MSTLTGAFSAPASTLVCNVLLLCSLSGCFNDRSATLGAAGAPNQPPAAGEAAPDLSGNGGAHVGSHQMNVGDASSAVNVDDAGGASNIDDAATATNSDAAGSASNGGAAGSAPNVGGASSPVTVGESSRDAYCAGKGPPVTIPQPQTHAATPSCATAVATRLFDHALCTCEDAVINGSFTVDGFDSSQGPYLPGGNVAGSVGTNAELSATADVAIHGSLVAAGTRGFVITSAVYAVDGNVEINSDALLTGTNILFGRDLWVNGNLLATGSASVAGTVYQPANRSLSGLIGGKKGQQSFQIADPCACGADQLLDVDAIVAAGKAANHNAAIGLAPPGSLLELGKDGTLDLDCGRFAFTDVAVLGKSTIRAHGRTALFVEGDLVITGTFNLDLGTTAEMDLFISGNLAITGKASIGSPERPSALRVYVGGSGDIAITGTAALAANLYAPRSKLVVTSAAEWYGSYLVGSYAATDKQTIHYDAAIMDASAKDACKPPADSCTRDLDCRSTQLCGAGNCIVAPAH